MNYRIAIVVAAGLIAGVLLFNDQGISQTSAGSYAMTPSVTQSQLPGVWRMDTATGQVSYCSISGTSPHPAPVCSPWSATEPLAPKNPTTK